MIESQPLARTPEGVAMTAFILTIFRVNGRLLRVGDTLSGEFGLTAARWQVLGAIAATPRTVAQIARYFESTRQGVLWVVTALIKDGIVELIDNPDHKRAKLVQFTAAGRKIYEDLSRRQTEWVNSYAGDFTLAELEAATSVLERLGNRVLE